MTRTQNAENARKEVDKFLKLHFPKINWCITRGRDTIIIESGRHVLGSYSPYCARNDMESGKLLRDVEEYIQRNESGPL